MTEYANVSPSFNKKVCASILMTRFFGAFYLAVQHRKSSDILTLEVLAEKVGKTKQILVDYFQGRIIGALLLFQI